MNEPEAAAERGQYRCAAKKSQWFAGLCIGEATWSSASFKPRSNVFFMLIVLESADQISVSVPEIFVDSAVQPRSLDLGHWISQDVM
jgi:hypothetical protein